MSEKIELLTKAECAEILGVSEATVERMIAAGQLPAYRIARAVTRISRADLLEYLDQRRVKVAALRQTRITGPKDLRQRQRIRDLPCPYVPGQKVVDPNV